VTTPATFRQSALQEIARHYVFAALLSKAPPQAREALELRSLLYGTAAKLADPRQIEVLFTVARLQGHSPKFAALCQSLA